MSTKNSHPDEVTNNIHPTTLGIMHVSLARLSQEKSAAGELAAFLLGKAANPENDDVKQISGSFEVSFKEFKKDKEVGMMLSLAERYIDEGRVEGRLEGRVEGVNIGVSRLAELLKSGLTLEDAIQKISEELKQQQ